MRTQYQTDDLIVAIDELCSRARLCKVSTVGELVGMDAAELVEALAPAVAQRHVLVLGAPRPAGFLWLTAAGAREARRLREARGAVAAVEG